MPKRLQKTTETRSNYLTAARKYAAKKFKELRERSDFKWAHESHAAVAALKITEKRFTDIGTFGVEGQDGIDIIYLNSGDSYEVTLYYYKRRFNVGCVGDVIERVSR